MKADRVPVAPLREAVLARDPCWRALAKDAGFLRTRSDQAGMTGDSSALKVALGIRPSITTSDGKRYANHAEIIGHARAVRIARAAHIDPIEAGL